MKINRLKTTLKTNLKTNAFKKIGVLMAILMMTSLFAGCGTKSADQTAAQTTAPAETTTASAPAEKATVRIATLKGPTGMTMVQMMDNQEKGLTQNNYEFSILSAPDEAVAKLTSGEADIICVPTNLAATLYAKTQGKVKMTSINTLGVMYVLQRGGSDIKSLADLKGKTVYSTGQGSTPEYVLNYLLEQNGIDPQKDLTIEYKAEHTELATLMASGKADIAVLPQPFVTSVIAKNPDIHVVLDLTEEWSKVVGADKPLAMSTTIVSAAFLEKHEDALKIFMDDLKASTAFTNQNLEGASALIEKYDIMPAAVAKAAIPECNMVYLEGAEMKTAASNYLDVIAKANPKSVGGQMPDDNIYYIR